MADIFPGAKFVQLQEWGYPKGTLRATPPPDKAFSVIHITANLATAESEAAWRLNTPTDQNSATFFNNRDGTSVQCLGDPLHMDPWANGDVKSPDMSNARIAAMVHDGVNANERTIVAIENVGNEIPWGTVPGGMPLTAAQVEQCAAIIAYYHKKAGVPINRETVVGHYQLNTLNRKNCPAQDKSVIGRIVARAQQIAGDDMFEWAATVKPVAYRSRIDEGAIIRKAPFLRPETAAFTTTRPSPITVLGEVQGDAFPNTTDKTWLVYVTGTGGLRCVHRRNRVPGSVDVPLSESPDCAAKEAAAAAAAKKAEDARWVAWLATRPK